jgi:BlaI family penicillinase repressor
MRLSDFELEVMQVLWDLGDTTAPEVHRTIAQTREISYSAVKTIIDRLEAKGALCRVSQVGRTIVYSSAIDEEVARAELLKKYTSKLYPGDDRVPLFNALIRERELSDDEISFLRDVLKQSGSDA